MVREQLWFSGSSRGELIQQNLGDAAMQSLAAALKDIRQINCFDLA
jgi:hypothetical protein